VEHVSDPNQKITWERPTYICPVCYPFGFFDEDGYFYGCGSGLNIAGALDSHARKTTIWLCLDDIKRRGNIDRIDRLRIEGEDDIPPISVLQELIDKEFCAIF